MTEKPIIRAEQAGDGQYIENVLIEAFETDAEAKLVSALRKDGCFCLSLVAENTKGILGHILLTPVSLANDIDLTLMGIAPLAVRVNYQGQGIGSALIEAGLAAYQTQHIDAVVVLGNPRFYGRFGFKPASRFGIQSVYEVDDKYFMLLELNSKSLQGKSGVVRYQPVFAVFE